MSYRGPQVSDSFSFKKKQEEKRKVGVPGGGWDNEDYGESIRVEGSSSKVFSKNIQESIQTEMKKSTSKPNEQTQNNTKKQIRYDVESKLIEDLIIPTGINKKPAENALKEFNRRAKSLNKEAIFNILMNKISQYSEIDQPNEIKSFIKSLFVIESLLISKTEGFLQLFEQTISIFNDISECFSKNKTVTDLCNSIINQISGEEKQKIQISEDKAKDKPNGNVNLLGFETNDDTFSGLEIRENSKTTTNNVNLLDLDFDKKVEINEKKVEKEKSFKFIKKEEINVLKAFDSLEQKPQNNEKSFKFIKASKQEVSKNNNEIDNFVKIIEAERKKEEPMFIDLTKSNNSNVNIDEIFTQKTQQNIDFSKFNNILGDQPLIQFGNTKEDKTASDLGIKKETEQFNYQFVQNTINPPKKKDHFDFVDDLLKKKK